MGNQKGISRVVALGFVLVSLPFCAKPQEPSPQAIEQYRASKGVTGKAKKAVKAEDTRANRVKLTIVGGTDLRDTDPMAGDPDPYVVLDYEGQRHQTAHIQGTSSPKWGNAFLIDLQDGGMLTVRVMDKDAFPAKDDLIGSDVVSIPNVGIEQTRTFEVKLNEGSHGTIQLKVTGLAP